jgi:hypothetical protein
MKTLRRTALRSSRGLAAGLPDVSLDQWFGERGRSRDYPNPRHAKLHGKHDHPYGAYAVVAVTGHRPRYFRPFVEEHAQAFKG